MTGADMARALFLCLFFIFFCDCKRPIEDQNDKFYLQTERPVLTFIDPKYYTFVNFTSTRYGRRNPLYYVNMHYTTLFTADNNLTASFWFYEYYASQYRRSFLEMSFKWCNLVYNDGFFGPALRKNLPKSCPHIPGDYHLYNMTVTVSAMPSFPFSKGRIYTNLSINHRTISSGYIDMELKRLKIK